MTRTTFHALGGTMLAVAAWLGFAPSAEALVGSKSCTLEAPGDACILDLTANANGTLKVSTKAGTSGRLWRSTIARVNTAGAASTVGTGSTTAFTGLASSAVSANVKYEAIVTYEGPLTGTFPSAVTVQVDGPVGSVPEPRRFTVGYSEIGPCKSDPQVIQCGSLVTCRLDPSADTDLYRFDAPAGAVALIRIVGGSTGTYWQLFSPSGSTIGDRAIMATTSPLTAAGRYTIEAYNYFGTVLDYRLGLRGVSQSFHCGPNIGFGETKTGSFAYDAQVDTHHFVGQLGQIVRIRITGPTGTYWHLYDPKGGIIGDRCGGECSATLQQGGTYSIAAYNYFGTSGTYTLNLHLLTGPSPTVAMAGHKANALEKQE